MRTVARRMLARLVEILNRLMPKQAHIVVHGFPGTEGNAVEIIRALVARYRGQIIWLDGPGQPSIPDARVRLVRRSSCTGILYYLTAEVVLFTHGLYGDPSPNSRQVVVNLWHGDGPKQDRTTRRRSRSAAPATYIVGSTRLFTEKKASDLRVDLRSIILAGNPRTDQFYRNDCQPDMRLLGLERGQPFVVWLPTFRRSRPVGLVGAREGPSKMSDADLNERIAYGAQLLNDAGLEVLIKRHPLDSDPREIPGARIVRDEELERKGISLYGILGASNGLVTDYSSVWSDYLLLDRPLAFFTPDEQDYTDERGLYPADVLGWLPGVQLGDETSFRRFAADVLSGGRANAAVRQRAADRLGLVRTTHAADDLLQELERRGAFRLSGGLLANRRQHNSNDC